MTDKPKQGNGTDRPKPAPRRWGADGDRVLERLQKKLVEVKLADGDTLTGGLAGYSEYQITLAMDSELVLLNKGHIVWIRPGKRNGEQNGSIGSRDDSG